MEDPSPTRRLIAAALAVAAVLLVAGCGGSSAPPDRDQVSATVLDYAHAFGAGDGAKACDQLTPAARARFLQLVALLARTTNCPTAVRRVEQAVGPQAAAAFRAARVSSVQVHGSTATARLIAGAQSAAVRLTKQGGRWRLAAAPGIAG